jgi:hypothetical protein
MLLALDAGLNRYDNREGNMKRVFVRVGVYLVLFPAVAIMTYLVSYLSWNVDFGLIIGIGYATLLVPALITSFVDFGLLSRSIRFRPLLVTLTGVLTTQFFAHRGILNGMPDLDFYAAIASLTCCLFADQFRPKAQESAQLQT